MSESFIPLSVPELVGNELKYVSDCITTGWVSSVGSYVNQFEEVFAKYVGTKYAVAVVNGTAALHISLLLSDVQPGDEVLVPNLTFVATINAVRYCNAQPVFMDSSWSNLGMDVEKLKNFIQEETQYRNGFSYNKRTGARIRAVVPMHTFGYPVDMNSLNEVIQSRNIKVIEDATESLGSTYHGRPTGSLSELACFSFNGNKIVTTGGGGMITTNNGELAARAKHITTTAKRGALDFDHDEVGYNYRLVNVLAAIGVAQMERLEEFVNRKRDNLSAYAAMLQNSGIFSMHTEPLNTRSNYWMYCLLIDPSSSLTVYDVIKHLEAHRIQARPVWKLMNSLPMFRDFQSYQIENSVDIRSRIVNIPCSVGLTKTELGRVVAALMELEKK